MLNLIAEGLGSDVFISMYDQQFNTGDKGELILYLQNMDERYSLNFSGIEIEKISVIYGHNIMIIQFEKIGPFNTLEPAFSGLSGNIVGWQLFKEYQSISPWVWIGVGFIAAAILKGRK